MLFHDTFSSNTPSSAWSFVGGTWKSNNGVLSQTSTAVADPKKAMITNQTYPSNLIVTSEVQVNSWNAGDMARAGIGLYTNKSNGNGYNLVFHGTNQVQFLNDKVAWGNAYTFHWQVGTWYWFQLAEINGTLEGKVWAAGTAEPNNWMFQQTGWTSLTGGAPALNGGSVGSTDSFASVSVTTTSVLPDTASAGSAFAAKPGSAVTFSQATATGTGPLTYAWNFGDGGTATGVLNPTYTYKSAGTYTAQLTVTDALGIPAMSTVTVTVNSAPTVSAGLPFTVNAGSAAVFSQATVSGGTAPFAYTWSFGDGTAQQSGSLNPSHTYPNPGSNTATVTVTDASKLTSSSSVVATVNDVAPTASMAGPSSGSVGTSLSYTASATDVSPAVQAAGFTYAWNFGDGGTGSGATASHSFASAGTYTVTVTAKDEYGKVGTASETTTISASSASPVVSAGGNITTNAGSTVTFAGSVSGGTAPYSESWNFGDGTTSTGNSGNSASFTQTDATTQGNWTGVYGAAGYNVIGSTSSYPSYATVTPSDQSSWTWAATTPDVRGLLIPGSTSRIAACWYSGTSFTIDVKLTDGQVHLVSLYAVDWDTTSRSEQIQVVDGSSGAVLNTQTISNFHGGEYLTWNVSGHVQFKVTALAGANAVLSGLFIGAGSSAGGSTLTPSHVYANPGTYTATLTATDSAGHNGTSSATVTVNDAAPTVGVKSPASGATNVAVSSSVSATFSEAVQASTINFTLTNPSGGTVASTVAYNSSTYTATLTPSAALANSTTDTATISGVKDMAGNPMSGPVAWSFTTASNDPTQEPLLTQSNFQYVGAFRVPNETVGALRFNIRAAASHLIPPIIHFS